MTPHQLLQHHDQGHLWPTGAGEAFTGMDAAYRAALAVRALRQARGERPRGYKVGFTNRTIWPRYQVFAPMWGTVWDSSLVDQLTEDPALGALGTVSLAGLCQPRLEPEVVFGFKAVPPPNANLGELVAALDWLAPGFEVVHCHQPGWRFLPPQTVADGGLHGRLLIGPRQPVSAFAAMARSWASASASANASASASAGAGAGAGAGVEEIANAGANADGDGDAHAVHTRLAAGHLQLLQHDQLVDQGRGDNVLGSPLLALQHFLRELQACPGAPDIAPGDVVTTGTWTDAWPVQPGETWTARFADSLLPSLRIRFPQA